MSTPPIVFALHLPEIMNHYLPIMRHLGADAAILNCAQVEGSEVDKHIEAMATEAGFAHLRLREVLETGGRFDVMVSNQPFLVPWSGEGDATMVPLARHHVRLLYALGKTEWNLAGWNRFYDTILCYGPYQKRLFEHHFPDTKVEVIGYPRFDVFFAGDTTSVGLRKTYQADPQKPNLVWLPTHGLLSSIDAFAEPIAALAGDYNIWVKLHPATPLYETARMEQLRALPFTALIEDATDNVALFRLADYVLADYGGSAFGAIYTDKNLLLLNHGADIFSPDTGWLSADIQLRDAFANLYAEDAGKMPALLRDNGLWEAQRAVRAKYRSALFEDTKGQAGARAAKVIEAARQAPPREQKRYDPTPLSTEQLRILVESKNILTDTQNRPWHARIKWVQRLQGEQRLAAQQAAEEKTRALASLNTMRGALAQAEEVSREKERVLDALNTTKEALAQVEKMQRETSREKEHALKALGETKDALMQVERLQLETNHEKENALKALSETQEALVQVQEALGEIRSALAQVERLQLETSQEKERVLEALGETKDALAHAEKTYVDSAERQRKFELALSRLQKSPQPPAIVVVARRLLERSGLYRPRQEKLQAETAFPQLLLSPVAPKKRPAFTARYQAELQRLLAGKRLVMVSDDLQIDRRILHEAHSLAPFGPEIIVIGRTGEGYPASESDGPVKIERIDYEAMHVRRAASQNAPQFLPSPVGDGSATISLEEATQHLSESLATQGWAGPRLERFVLRQPRPLRVALKLLIWPPYRWELLRRYLPSWRTSWLAALYVPTLLLTPRPKVIAQHWKRAKPILHRRLLGWQAGDTAAAEAVEKALTTELLQPETMNLWEQAIYEHLLFLRPDIVHVHDLPQLRPSVFAAEKLGIPVIYDAHELYPTIHTLSPEQQTRLWLTEAVFMPRTQRTITVNPFFAAHQVQSYGVAEPEVILNATTLPEGFERGKKLRLFHEMLQLSAEQKVILFQGWISIDRRIGDIIDAMSDVPPHIHLVLMGYGSDIPALKKRARSRGVETRVHFVAPVPQAELMPYVASADAGIVPYQPIDDCHRYCSPNKLFEFIAAGVPLIVNDLPYLRSVVQANGFGVAELLATPADYARAICRMFASQEGDETRFRERVLQHAEPFLWPAQEQVLLHLYREVLRSFALPRKPSAQIVPLMAETPVAAQAFAAPGGGALRVFHGPGNAAGIPSIMAKAERALGLDSKAICYPNGAFQYSADELLEITQSTLALEERFQKYADAFDVFVFHFGQSLANDTLTDIPLLKQMGKSVIFYFHGCDIRQSKETIRNYEFSACKACWPQRCSRNRDLALEMATTYADAIWVSTPDLLEFVPRSELFLQPIMLDDFPFHPRAFHAASADNRLRVVHAPSDRQLKGTAYLERAIEQLHAEHAPLDLVLLHGLTHEELRARLNDADFGVDQLLFGSYGMLAVEQMALGLPVICYVRDDVWAHYPEPPPIWRTTPVTVRETLQEAMRNPARLQEMAIAGRAYVERHHSAEVAAQRALATYRRIRGARRLVA